MVHKIEQWLHRTCRDDRGLTTVEYAIVLCLIAALAVIAWSEFGTMIEEKLRASHTRIEDNLEFH